MTDIDTDAIRKEWLRQCGLCDAGLLTECTCPKGDVRALISSLLAEVDHLKRERDEVQAYEQVCPACDKPGRHPETCPTVPVELPAEATR